MTQQINLFEASLLPQREWLTARRLVAAGGVAAVIVAGHWVAERSVMARVVATMANTAAPAATETTAVDAELAPRERRLASLRSLAGAGAVIDTLPPRPEQRLAALVSALPTTMWLTEIEWTGARAVRIAGGALAPQAVAEYAERLGRLDDLRGLPLYLVRLEPAAVAADADGARKHVGAGQSFEISSAAPPDAADVALAGTRP